MLGRNIPVMLFRWLIFGILHGEFYVQGCTYSLTAFQSCGQDTGYKSTQAMQVSQAVSNADCTRQCRKQSSCLSVNVQQTGDRMSPRICQMFREIRECSALERLSGYKYYAKISETPKCGDIFPIEAAMRDSDDEYTLVGNGWFQKFKLKDGKLVPQSCEERYSTQYTYLKGAINDMFQGTIFDYKVVFVIRERKVELFWYIPRNKKYSPFYARWPKSFKEFFGDGSPSTIDAVVGDQGKAFIFSGSELWESHAENQTFERSVPYANHLYNMTDNWGGIIGQLDAATSTSETGVLLLFSGKKVYRFDRSQKTILSSSVFCSG